MGKTLILIKNKPKTTKPVKKEESFQKTIKRIKSTPMKSTTIRQNIVKYSNQLKRKS